MPRLAIGRRINANDSRPLMEAPLSVYGKGPPHEHCREPKGLGRDFPAPSHFVPGGQIRDDVRDVAWP